jgi:hypothetical protein
MDFRWLAAAVAATGCWLAICQPALASPRPIGFQRGITVGEWGPHAYRVAPVRRTFARLRALNVDTVTLFAAWAQRKQRTNQIFSGREAQPSRNLIAAIRSARSAGLRVILRPYIDVDDGTWRGAIHPSNLSRWFASYDRFIMRYARIAGRERVDGFVVGTEMQSLSGRAGRWRALVTAVRHVFPGFVSYQANWDEAADVSWWDALDTISVSAYYPLSATFDPTTAELVSGWSSSRDLAGAQRNWFAQLDELHRRFNRTVFFGEIGYRPVTGTATRPWGGEPWLGERSLSAQEHAYEAALQVWSSVPWFRGFEWWYLAPQPRLVRGTSGADHRPRTGTLRLLGEHYAKLHR